MESEAIILTYPKYRELEASYSGKSICEECKLKGMVYFHGKRYVSIGAGYQHGKCNWIWAYECIPESEYSGKPMTYMEHYYKQLRGEVERSYTGIGVSYKGERFVIIGKQIEFHPSEEGKQKSLFDI